MSRESLLLPYGNEIDLHGTKVAFLGAIWTLFS